MTYPVITHQGAIVGVTGSCHQLHLNAVSSLLIDCGLFQAGTGRSPGPAIEFPISGIEALLVTHIHLDHVGRIPGLLAASFKGSTICSQPSARLLPLVLEDALRPGVTQEKAT